MNQKKGWHDEILFNDINVPFIKPCALIDSIVYSEQVGRNLQFDPNKGDINIW